MLFPSLLLAMMPAYSSIGVAATLGLIIIRCCQGVAAGGELVGSMLYTVESAPQEKRGMYGAFAFSFAIVGTMLGTLVSSIIRLIFAEEGVMLYGWRVGYIIGFLIGIAGVQLRKGLEESPEFTQAKAEIDAEQVVPSNPLKDAFTKYNKEVLMVMTTVSIWCCGMHLLTQIVRLGIWLIRVACVVSINLFVPA